MIKVVYFNYLFDIEGISIGSAVKPRELFSALGKFGYDVKIFWQNYMAYYNDDIESSYRWRLKRRLSKYLHEPKEILSNLKYMLREDRILQDEHPDLVIAALDANLFSALLLAGMKKVPFLLEADAPVVYETKRFYPQYIRLPGLCEFLERINLKFADGVIVVSNEAKKYFTQRGITEDKIFVIPNGADPERFGPDIDGQKVRAEYNLCHKTVIGFVGSFHYWHGVENLIRVIEAALSQNKNVSFLMVGKGGPMKKELEQFAVRSGYGNEMILTGYIPHEEVPEYISAMDIALAPYPRLDFFYYSPVKVFEYMCCGKPVVTARIGQISEIIQDGWNGFLYEPGDMGDLQNKVSLLVNNRKLRRTIGQRARETILKKYTWQKNAERLADVCSRLINQPMH